MVPLPGTVPFVNLQRDRKPCDSKMQVLTSGSRLCGGGDNVTPLLGPVFSSMNGRRFKQEISGHL